MVTCQSANQLKTPAKVSWAFKMVSQFGSLGYTIMGKTADLTVVQKTIIDTLHKEGKPQTFIAKEAGCSQSAVSKHVNRKLSERKKCGRKRCTTNRENRSLMRIVKQNRFKNLGELHKEWTEAGVKASRAPHTDVSRNLATVVIRGILPGLRRRRTGLLPSGPKSSFQMRASFVFHLETKVLRVWRKGGEAHSPSCLKSSVKFLQSVTIWGAMSSAGVGQLCFLKTNVTAPVYQYILEHFMLPSADQLFKDADFIFLQDLAPAHTAKSTKSKMTMVLVCLTGQQTHQTWTSQRIYGVLSRGKWETKKTKKCRWAEGHSQRNLGFHTTSAVTQTDHLHATPNWGSN